MNQAERKALLREQLTSARERTLWLFSQVPDDFLKRRVHQFYSPIGWHFGHIGRTEEFWVVSQALGKPVLDEHLSFLLADLPENPKDNRVHIPDRAGLSEYLRATRERTLQALEEADLEGNNPLVADGYGWDFALQHECQHQETIAEMLTLIHRECASGDARELEWPAWAPGIGETWVEIPAGQFRMGSDDPGGYDNEKRAHSESVAAFTVARHPVTAYAWSRFIQDRGYLRPDLWSQEGWAWKCTEGVELPEYWSTTTSGFGIVGAAGPRPVHPDEPVSSISWFEAEAYAKWAGARLLTEPEWEYVASFRASGAAPTRYPWGDEEPDESRAANGLRTWRPSPVGMHKAGSSGFGVEDLAGGVWEWTSSPFLPYDGFAAFPYDGYSKDHMEGAHRVCRGGSWATANPILRSTFRNWYVPSYRQGFLGLRLAKSR